jgi:ferric-dicitrate binding protein FerR (iron transport regulator)
MSGDQGPRAAAPETLRMTAEARREFDRRRRQRNWALLLVLLALVVLFFFISTARVLRG